MAKRQTEAEDIDKTKTDAAAAQPGKEPLGDSHDGTTSEDAPKVKDSESPVVDLPPTLPPTKETTTLEDAEKLLARLDEENGRRFDSQTKAALFGVKDAVRFLEERDTIDNAGKKAPKKK